jgi:hypothetical protein
MVLKYERGHFHNSVLSAVFVYDKSLMGFYFTPYESISSTLTCFYSTILFELKQCNIDLDKNLNYNFLSHII